MNPDDADSLLYDWAECGPRRYQIPGGVEVNDETLRDGLQSVGVTDPPVDVKIQLVHLMEELEIECASMGIPGAGPRQKTDVTRLCQAIADHRLNLRPNCGGRTLVVDVEHIVDVAQATGQPVEASLFIGSSPIRHYAEEWDLEVVCRHTRDAVGFAVGEGLPVMFITEDTVRSAPDQLEILLRTAVDAGASRVCLCDTVGAAIPAGTGNLVAWVRHRLAQWGVDVGIDWHGHRDRGLGLANTLAAIEAGASRVHGTAHGVGERVGNTATEEILLNLHLLGGRQRDLSRLPEFVQAAARALEFDIRPSSPIVGRNAFRTATGVHAAAVLKARQRQEHWIADRVYTAVPASLLGRELEIEVGPLSGSSNVIHFLRSHGESADADTVAEILSAAKSSRRVLSAAEIRAIIDRRASARDAAPRRASER